MICSQWILTAAHCIAHQSFHRNEPDLNPEDYRLFFGRQFGVLYKTGPQVEVRSGVDIERIVPHPHFNPVGGVMFNDIALIKLSRPLEFNTFVQPACLPLNGEDSPKPGETGWANGWGLTRGFGPDNTGTDRFHFKHLSSTGTVSWTCPLSFRFPLSFGFQLSFRFLNSLYSLVTNY